MRILAKKDNQEQENEQKIKEEISQDVHFSTDENQYNKEIFETPEEVKEEVKEEVDLIDLLSNNDLTEINAETKSFIIEKTHNKSNEVMIENLIEEQTKDFKQEEKENQNNINILKTTEKNLASEIQKEEIKSVNTNKESVLNVVEENGSCKDKKEDVEDIQNKEIDLIKIASYVKEIEKFNIDQQIKLFETLKNKKNALNTQIMQFEFQKNQIDKDIKKYEEEIKQISGLDNIEDYALYVLNTLKENDDKLELFQKEIEEKEKLIQEFKQELENIDN